MSLAENKQKQDQTKSLKWRKHCIDRLKKKKFIKEQEILKQNGDQDVTDLQIVFPYIEPLSQKVLWLSVNIYYTLTNKVFLNL